MKVITDKIVYINYGRPAENKEVEIMMNQKEIKKLCEENKVFKNWYLTQHGTKSVEKAFRKENYWDLCVKAAKRKEEKQKEFENKEIKYLADLLKKLKKIFNKAKKEKDLKQLQYLNGKLWKVCGDKQLKNNVIRLDYYELQFEVRKEIRLQGEN